MLLDTMCNTFGGIILLAVLVTLLANRERLTRPGKASETRDMLERRLAVAESNLAESRRLFADLQAKANDPRWTNQLNLLSTRRNLQHRLRDLQETNDNTAAEIEIGSSKDPADRLRALQARLAAAQAHKTERENSFAAVQENRARLRQRLTDMERQVSVSFNASVHQLRFPKEYQTGKRAFYVIVQYGRVYPCRNSDLSRNESIISWTLGEDAEIARPIPGKGFDPGGTTGELQAFFRSVPRDLVYVAFCVFEDSFVAFNRSKEITTNCGLAYGWEPFRDRDGPVSFSSVGYIPKPQ